MGARQGSKVVANAQDKKLTLEVVGSKDKYEFNVLWVKTAHGMRLLIVKNGRRLWLTPREASRVVCEVLRSYKINVNIRFGDEK